MQGRRRRRRSTADCAQVILRERSQIHRGVPPSAAHVAGQEPRPRARHDGGLASTWRRSERLMPLVRVELFERRLTPAELESRRIGAHDRGAARRSRGSGVKEHTWVIVEVTTPMLGPQRQTVDEEAVEMRHRSSSFTTRASPRNRAEDHRSVGRCAAESSRRGRAHPGVVRAFRPKIGALPARSRASAGIPQPR